MRALFFEELIKSFKYFFYEIIIEKIVINFSFGLFGPFLFGTGGGGLGETVTVYENEHIILLYWLVDLGSLGVTVVDTGHIVRVLVYEMWPTEIRTSERRGGGGGMHVHVVAPGRETTVES